MIHRPTIVVLDHGSPYSQLITRRLRELGVFSRLLPATRPPNCTSDPDLAGVIVSGAEPCVAGGGLLRPDGARDRPARARDRPRTRTALSRTRCRLRRRADRRTLDGHDRGRDREPLPRHAPSAAGVDESGSARGRCAHRIRGARPHGGQSLGGHGRARGAPGVRRAVPSRGRTVRVRHADARELRASDLRGRRGVGPATLRRGAVGFARAAHRGTDGSCVR